MAENTKSKKVKPAKVKPEKVYKGTGLYWGFLAVLITLVALVILAAQNTAPVRFSFAIWELEYPLVAIILATIGFSVLLDEAVGFVWRRRRRRALADRAELRELRAKAATTAENAVVPVETGEVSEPAKPALETPEGNDPAFPSSST